jgi:hypothetical protein
MQISNNGGLTVTTSRNVHQGAGPFLLSFCDSNQLLTAIELDASSQRLSFYLKEESSSECVRLALINIIMLYLAKAGVKAQSISMSENHPETFHSFSFIISKLTHFHLVLDKKIDTQSVKVLVKVIKDYQYSNDRVVYQKGYFEKKMSGKTYFEQFKLNYLMSPEQTYLNNKTFITNNNYKKAIATIKAPISSSTATIHNIFSKGVEEFQLPLGSFAANTIHANRSICPALTQISANEKIENNSVALGAAIAFGVVGISAMLFSYCKKPRTDGKPQTISKKRLAS